MSPCISHINKVYQFIGPSDGPIEQLVTDMNFYAADACIGITHSFVTKASLTQSDSSSYCDEGI